MVSNIGKITNLAGTPSTGLVDGSDKLHSGILKVLESFSQGDMCISHAGFTIDDDGTYTQYNLAQPIKFLKRGEFVNHTVTLTEAYTSSPVQNASHTRYDWVLINPATPELVIVQGTAASTPTVADITAGYIPIALVQITAGTTDDKSDYSFQTFTLDVTKKSLSIMHGGVEAGNITGDADSIDIVSTITNGDINITPNGNGKIVLDGLNWPTSDGSADQVLKTDGSGQLSFVAQSGGDVVDDTTPQLGGTLESNGNLIKFGDSASATDDRIFFGAGDDLGIWHDGAQSHIYSASRAVYLTGGGNLYLRPKNGEDGIILNTDGAAEVYHDDSKVMETVSDGIKVNTDLKLSTSSDNAIIENVTEDKDILFKGLDGSTTITALSLDISDAGKATFNAGAEFKKDVTIYEDANNADVSLSLGTSATESLTISVLNGASNKTAEEVHFSTATASSSTDAGKMVFDIDGTDKLVIDDAGIDVTGSINATTTITASTILTGADTIGQASLTTQGLFHQVPETLDQTTSAPVMSGANSIVYVFDISNAPSASPPGNSNIVELPDPNTVANAVFTIRNVGSNSIDINVQGGQPIDGGLTTHALVSVANTITLPIGQHVTVQAVTDSVAPLVTGYYIIGN